MFNKSKRKIYLINPKFQLRFILFSVSVSLLGMSVFFASIKYFFWSFKQMGEEFGISKSHIFFRFIDDQNYKMNLLFLTSAILVLAISSIGALFLSHRVAGPIHRMTSHLKATSENELIADVKFRKNDEFIELQDAFNEFAKKIKSK